MPSLSPGGSPQEHSMVSDITTAAAERNILFIFNPIPPFNSSFHIIITYNPRKFNLSQRVSFLIHLLFSGSDPAALFKNNRSFSFIHCLLFPLLFLLVCTFIDLHYFVCVFMDIFNIFQKHYCFSHNHVL